MTASTANSGKVCNQAKIAKARPLDIKYWAASAPQPMAKDENKIVGNVHKEAKAFDFAACKVKGLIKAMGSSYRLG